MLRDSYFNNFDNMLFRLKYAMQVDIIGERTLRKYTHSFYLIEEVDLEFES